MRAFTLTFFITSAFAKCTLWPGDNRDDLFLSPYDQFDKIGRDCFGFEQDTTILGDIARLFDVIYGRGYYRSWSGLGRFYSALDTEELFERTIETDFVLAGYYLLDESTTSSILNGSEVGFVSSPISSVVNLFDWLSYGIVAFEAFELNYYNDEKNLPLEELVTSMRDWFMGIVDFLNRYYIDQISTISAIFLSNSSPDVIALKILFFELDYFFNWLPSILLYDFTRVQTAYFELANEIAYPPHSNSTYFHEEYWPQYINKITTLSHKLFREFFMLIHEPFLRYHTCPETDEKCSFIRYLEENLQGNILYLYLDFMASFEDGLIYVDNIFVALSTITWLGSFAERFFLSIGDIVEIILEIDDIVVELALEFARAFGQLLSDLLASILSSAV
ncbi:Oidioi.mRNA.OKI2018_I69.chr1.g138.t1.cds [Oikopleura dioica]|uniref:Oidioi.mRNA.OKI2018_I69.chr1.g138.t1.cds n=1 Tax=Oikopleura dioica TaxID=34765 RepID=A0ABN7SKM9_OIKDI|nr:Oidioi.mRNA.OKI2018_I69.chr1.g138.t1.cds [Oikopleura dioica]